MSGPGTPRRPRCGIEGCRSRRYHVDNGLTYCSNGHQQEGLIETAQEFEDLNWAASQTTRIHDSQKQAETAAKIEALGGTTGLHLFLRLFQLVLRHQIWSFEKLMCKSDTEDAGRKPSGIEDVVYDLWGMRLVVLEDAGLEIRGDSSKARSKRRKRKQARRRRGRARETETEVDTETEAEHETETETENEDDDGNKDVRPPGSTPKLIETIALLYIGANILKIPITLSKLQQWVREEELHWLKAFDLIPEKARESMAPGYQTIFMPHAPLRDGELHKSVARLTVAFQDKFTSLRLPKLNYPPILLDYLVRLALPFHLYDAAQHLLKFLNADLTTSSLTHLTAGWLVYELPEMQILALLVVAAKLYFPLDENSQYHSLSKSDISSWSLDWDVWDQIHRESETKAADKNKRTHAYNVNVDHRDVHSMTHEDIDAYMDWYQDTWANMTIPTPKGNAEKEAKEPSTQLRSKVFAIFPPQEKRTKPVDKLERRKDEAERVSDMLGAVYATLTTRESISAKAEGKGTGPVLRIGSRYVQYRNREELAVHPWAKTCYERVARVAGLPVQMLITAVLAMEDRIMDLKSAGASEDEVAGAHVGVQSETDDGDVMDNDAPASTDTSDLLQVDENEG